MRTCRGKLLAFRLPYLLAPTLVAIIGIGYPFVVAADEPAEIVADEAPAAASAERPSVESFPQPTETEQRILDALKRRVTFEFQGPLGKAGAAIEKMLDDSIDIQFDERAMEDSGVGLDTPVAVHVRNVSLSVAIERLLASYDLTTLIADEVLLITTHDKADTELRTRVYPVGDLVAKDYDSIIQVITTTVRPQTWDEVGGPGSVSPFAEARCLVISQTDRMHDEILELLRALRAASQQTKSID